jgi:hypothetical protein
MYRHGDHTKEAIELRRWVSDLARQAKALDEKVDGCGGQRRR